MTGRTFKDCVCVKATDRALLVEHDELGTAWVPMSQVDNDSEVYDEGDEGKLIVSTWFAGKINWE